jgi:cyclopropane fatty-acyl-phospholipid synthase-like methyltransferase
MKQYSEACEQNRDPILAVLRGEFSGTHKVLEIGSGTGQHAVYFAAALPHLHWHTSDLAGNHAGIRAWLDESGLGNLVPPVVLDTTVGPWPGQKFDGVFSANTTHIMSWPAVCAMFTGIGDLLEPGGKFCLYGPFNYDGRYTSASNERFDHWLKSRDPESGIRNFEELDRLAAGNGLQLRADHEMPANNRLLVWTRTGS